MKNLGEIGVICTHSGIAFNVLDPQPEQVSIDDIAHHLSMACRFTGATKYHYSVAQHSIYVSRLLSKRGADLKTRLAGLLHDASEAYLCDIATPVKRSLQFAGYYPIEERVQTCIMQALRLPTLGWQAPAIKDADWRMYEIERMALLPKTDWYTLDCNPVAEIDITEWTPTGARHRFLMEFRELTIALSSTVAA